MEIIDLKETKKQQNQEDNYINMLVSRRKIEWIAFNFKVSSHAEIRFIQRDTALERDLKQCIRRSPLCWKQVDGSICIAFDLYNYIVVVEDDNNVPIIKTFLDAREDKRAENLDVWQLAMMEYKKFISKRKGV